MIAIPQATADKVLARCGRHCCVCRKFRPLLLQVHHIKEQNEGGGHEEDNLIATCVNCHAEVHTETKLTRRFTEKELKLHRDAVYKLVEEGKLVEVADHDNAIEKLTELLAGVLTARTTPVAPQPVDLLPLAADILITAASSTAGWINVIEFSAGYAVVAPPKQFDFQGDPRKMAALRKAVKQLISHNLIEESRNGPYYVSLEGYQLADDLIALAAQSKE